MRNDLIPTRYSNFIVKERNFIEKFRDLAETLGIRAEDMNNTIDILEAHIDSYSNMISKRAESKAATEDHILKNKKATKEFRRIARLVSASKNYNSAIGQDLGIISTQKTEMSPEEEQPVLRISANGTTADIKFTKHRKDGIVIFSKRGDEKEFSFLDNCAISPFKDKREKLDNMKPENREYYAVFLKNYKQTGKQSDIVKVTIP